MEPPSFPSTGARVARAAPGSDAAIALPLPSGSPPFHFEWSRAGAKLDDRFKPTHDAGGVRLTISAARTGDSGVYTLQATNAAGKDSTRVRLEVSPDEEPIGDDPPTFLRRLQDLTVKVGTRTRFLVEIVSSTECRVTWYRNERRLLEAERIALVRDGNFWCADISAVSVDDAGRWTCTAENVGGRASCSAHLNVLVPKAYKRPEFVEELRALLTEQGTVSLECKVVGVPTPVLRWFKDSCEIKAGDVFALTANADDPTSLGTYTCEAVNCMGRAYSSSKVHVIGRASREGSARPTSGVAGLEPPPIFTKELEDQFVRICEPLTLSCNIVVPPWPRSIVWYNKEGKVEPSNKYRIVEDGVGGYLLEVPSAEWQDEGEWKCVATSSGGRIGISTCYVSMDVPKNYRKPRFMENLQAVLTEEGLVSFECKVVGFPTPVLSWFKDGQELKPGDVYQLTGTNSLGSYCCIAKNCMGQTSSSAELTVEDIQNQLNEEEKLQLFTKNQAPKFLQGLKSVEAKIDEPFRFTIRVAIPPEPTVLWYRDDQPVDESSRCHHGKEERGVFFLDIKSLEFMDQAEWKCVAMNDFGHSVTSCFLKLIIPRHYKKPRFLENLQAILSDEGAVNLECKVIGVPQPVLKWYKDGEELKPGDIHRIISGQDGTCCLGTYTCEAQNCMGIAASSASLLGFEDSIKAKNKNKVDEQTLQRNLSLSTIHEERTSQMYDTPVGDITLDDKGEISFSFDGKEVSVSLYETPDLTEEEALQIVEMYADQLSENVTEHNVVELPPLRFVKETSTSGNLLMEAIIIDVSPEYFTSPEEDLRTEADIDDISIADENGPPQLSLDQEVDGEDYLEKTMALLSEEKADFPKKSDRKKSDSHKSGDDYFSLSRDQSLSEEKKDDDTQVLSESDLQSFASARSNGKPKSKSSKPSIDDGQESSEITRTVLLKEDLQTTCQLNESESKVKNKRERRSRSARRSSSGSDKIREVLESNFDNTLIKDMFQQESFHAIINSISLSLTKVTNGVQMIERDTILKSELMSSAATATRSLEIISNFIAPLTEIQSIIKAIGESVSESHEVTTSLFNKLPQPISKLYQTLTIIEKCMDVESENKTLVKKTCTNIIDKCGDDLNNLFTEINTIINKVNPYLDDICVVSIQSKTNTILKTIRSSQEVLNESKKITDKSETKLDKITPDTKHLQKTQKAVYELRNPLKSLLYIAEEVDISSFISAENITSQIILNDMSIPIQDLQNALEQIENLSVSETQSDLQQYNTEIIEAVMDSVLKLRSSFEQLSVKAVTQEKEEVLSKALLDIKHNITEISNHLDKFEAKVGQFNILQSENKLEALQKMAQILINLENNVGIFDFASSLKAHMTSFHKNLTKVLEHVIESNEANKYFVFLDICDAVNRLNTVIKNVDSNDMISLAGISNNLKTIQAIINKNEFTPELNFSITSNVTELLTNINETINYADASSYSMISENVEDLSIRQLEEEKLNIMLEHIEKAISLTSNIVSLETTKDLVIQQSLTRIIPTLEEIKYCVASLNETEQEENITDMRNFSFTQAVANQLCELNQGISVLYQVICEKISDRVDIDKLKAELATPLVEIRNALEILQQDVISQNIEYVSDVNITIADVVQSVQSCIIMIQEQDVLENADELSTLEDISAIKTSAEILGCDNFVSPIIQETITNFNDPETSFVHVQSMQSPTTETFRDLNDHILMLQTPEIIEIINKLSKNPEYSNVKSVTTELDKVHCAVESILHPVTFDESQTLLTSVTTSQLAALVQPLEELYHALVVIDCNQPVETDLLLDKIEFSKNISILENKVRKTLDYLHVAIETADITLDISTKIKSLHLLCEQLKKVLQTVKNDTYVDKPQLVLLHDSVSIYLDVTSCLEGINIVQVKLSLERLHQIIITVQDEILSCAQEKAPVLQYEINILRLIEDIKNTIASLAETDFVDIFVQEDQEEKYEKLNKIESIVEKLANSVKNVPQSLLNNNLESMKGIVVTCNDEISLLCSLLKQKITPRCIIKILQVFYAVCQNLEELQLLEKQSSSVSEDLSEWMINSKESLKNVQALMFQVIDAQSNLIFDIPITKLKSDESVLNKMLEINANANLCNFVNLLMDSIKIIKPWFGNIQAEILKELESCGKIHSDEDVVVDTLYDLLEKCLSEYVHSENVGCDQNLEAIYKVIQKNSDCKRVKGSAKKIIFINCVSDCLHILKQSFVESSERLIDEETTSKKQELKSIIAELSEPFETFHKKLTNICNQNMDNIEKSNILKELESLQVPLETINEVTKEAEKCMEIENLPIKTDTIKIAKDLLTKINLAHNNFNQLENIVGSLDMIINKKTIEEMEIILSSVLSKEVICKEIGQLEEKTDSFLQHMEHYIEVIEIVEETCAVLKLDDFKKSADIVRELRENLISELSPDIYSGDSQQMQLVQNLQNVLTSLQAGTLECKQELAVPISDDVRQQIVTAVSELQNDLIAITSIMEENSEILETGNKLDGNDQIIVQNEKSLLSSQIVKQNEQYAIIDSEENTQEKTLQTYSDTVNECALSEILQNEEHLTNIDDVNTSTTEVFCEDRMKENDLENFKEVLKLNIDTECEDNELNFEEIKESLFQHINYYLSENVIKDITKVLSSENSKLLEQSIRVANEVRDTAVLENNISSLNQLEFLKQHLGLVEKLQDLMVTINDKNINNVFKQSNAEFAVHNLLDCLKLYAMTLNNIIEAKHISVDSKISVENKFNETEEDFTKTKVIICDENISVSEDSQVNISSENINFGETLKEETDIDEKKPDKVINTDYDKSESKIVKNLQVTEESKEGEKTEDNQLDNEMFPINVHGVPVNAENKSEAECTTKDYDHSNDVNVVRDKTNITEKTTSLQDENISVREELLIEEKQISIHELETLLQEINETLDLSLNNSLVYNSDKLQDTLEEVQTVIMKLKYEFDGSNNDVLNECIEDLECNVRSVQLQINENSPPELLNEECMNLQTLVTAMNNIYNTQTKLSESPAHNALCICTNDIERSIDLLDEIPDSNVDIQLDNIILCLNEIKNTMKCLKLYFSSDAETLILRGIEVTQLLNLVEDKVFVLEKDLDANSKIDTNFRDGMVSAIHSIYGSISNMRGTISSIQKRYMYENYGQPSDNFLKSIKNVYLILNYEGKEEWKQFAKSLRKVLNHFEDIKFYINFDKTARLPSDSTFTKIILSELNTVLSEVILNIVNNSNGVSDSVQQVVSYVREILNGLENQTALEVKEKIPIFRELSNRIINLTNTIKTLIKETKDSKNKSSDNVSIVNEIGDIVLKISTVESNEKDSSDVSEKLLETNDTVNSDVLFKTLDEKISEVTNDQQKNNVIETTHVNTAEKNNGHGETYTQSEMTKSETSAECKDTIPEQKNAEIIKFGLEPTQDVVLKEDILIQDIEMTQYENIGTIITTETNSKELHINIQNEQEEIKLIDDRISGVSSLTDNINNKNEKGQQGDEKVSKILKDSIADEENKTLDVISLDDNNLQESITDQKEKCAETPHSVKSSDDVIKDAEHFPDNTISHEIDETTLDVKDIESKKHEDDETQHEIITKDIIIKVMKNENKAEETTSQYKEDISTKPEAIIEKQLDQHSILEEMNNQDKAGNNVKEADQIVLDHTYKEIISFESNNLVAEQIDLEEIKEEKCFSTELKPNIAIFEKSQKEDNITHEYKTEESTLPQNVELKYSDDNNLETRVLSYENNTNLQSVQSEKENELIGMEKLVMHCMEGNLVDTEKDKNDKTAAIPKITLDQSTEGLAETMKEVKDEEPNKEKSNDKTAIFLISKSQDLEIGSSEEGRRLQEKTIKDLHEQDIKDLEDKQFKKGYAVNEEDDMNKVKTAQISKLTEFTDLPEPQSSSSVKKVTENTFTRIEKDDKIMQEEVTGKFETENERFTEEISKYSNQKMREITDADTIEEIGHKDTFFSSELHDLDISNKKKEESQSNLQEKLIEGIDQKVKKTCEVSGIDEKNNVVENQHMNTENYEKTHAGSIVKNYGKAEHISFEEEFFEDRIHKESDSVDKASQSIVIFDQKEEPISVPTSKMFKVIQDEIFSPTEQENETVSLIPKEIEDSNGNKNLQNVERQTNKEYINEFLDNTNKEMDPELACEKLKTVSIVENLQEDHRKDENETKKELKDLPANMTELTKLTQNCNEVAPLPESNKNDQQYQEQTVLCPKESGNVLGEQANDQRIEPKNIDPDNKQTITDIIPLGEDITKHSENNLKDSNATIALNLSCKDSLNTEIKEIECAVLDEEIGLSKQHEVCTQISKSLQNELSTNIKVSHEISDSKENESFEYLSKTNDAETENKSLLKEDVKEKLKDIEPTLYNQALQIEMTAQNEALCIKIDGQSSLSEMAIVQGINNKVSHEISDSKENESIEYLSKTNDAETENKSMLKEDVKEKFKDIEPTLDNQASQIEITAQNEALCMKKVDKSSLSEMDIVQKINNKVSHEISDSKENESIEYSSKTNDAGTEKKSMLKEDVKEKLKDIEPTLDNQASQIEITAQNEALCMKKVDKSSLSEMDIVQKINNKVSHEISDSKENESIEYSSKTNDAGTEKKSMLKDDVKEKLKDIEPTVDNQASQIEITAQNEALCMEKVGKSSLSEMDIVQEINNKVSHEMSDSKENESIEYLSKTNDAGTEKKSMLKEDVKEKLKDIKPTLDNQALEIEMTAQNEALCIKIDGQSSLSEMAIVQGINNKVSHEISDSKENESIEYLSKTNDAETENKSMLKEDVKEKVKDIEHKPTLDNQTSQIEMTAQNEALCIKKDGKSSLSEMDIVRKINNKVSHEISDSKENESIEYSSKTNDAGTEKKSMLKEDVKEKLKDIKPTLDNQALQIEMTAQNEALCIKIDGQSSLSEMAIVQGINNKVSHEMSDSKENESIEYLSKTNDAETENKSMRKEDVKEKVKDIEHKPTLDNQTSQIEMTAQNEALCIKKDSKSSLSEMDIVQEINNKVSHEISGSIENESIEYLSKANDAETEKKSMLKEDMKEKLKDIEPTLDNQASKIEITAQNEALCIKKDGKSSLSEMYIVQEIKTVIPVNRNEENVHEEQVQQQEIAEKNGKDVQLDQNSEILEINKDEKTNVHVNKTLKVLNNETEHLKEETKNKIQDTTQKRENVEENEIAKKAASKQNQKYMNSETSEESKGKVDSPTKQNVLKINDKNIINLENVEKNFDPQYTLETVQILKEDILTKDESEHLTPLVESMINKEIGNEINLKTNKEEEGAIEEVLLDDLHKDKNILKDEKEDKAIASVNDDKKIKKKSFNIKKVSKKVDTNITEKDVGQLPSETIQHENESLKGKGKEDERRISIYEEELNNYIEDKKKTEVKRADQRNEDLFMREKPNLQKINDTKNYDKYQILDDKEVKKTLKNIEYEIIEPDESFCDESKQKSKIDIQDRDIIVRTEPEMQEGNLYRDQKIKQRPLFVDRSEPDYELEFARPSGYTTKQFDTDQSLTEFKSSGKSPTIYKTETLLYEAQLKSSVPPYLDRQSLDSGERTELKQKSKTRSETRNIVSEKRGSFPRDVKRKPVFSTHLTDRTAVEGSRVKLTCSILSSTDPVIHWYKNGTLLDNKQKCRTKHVDGLITMEILNAVPSDSGEYSCTVENEYGSITSSANLKVYPGFEASPIPPTFTRSIRDMYHSHENELVLECRIRGQPLPIITWLKDNRPIILNEKYQAHYLADGVCRLTVSSPTEDDSGKYTCKAENSMWSDQISHDVHFTSKKSCHLKNIATTENIHKNRQTSDSRRPHFTNVLSDHKVVSGGTIGLQVEISGSPTRVEWLREGRSVTETYRNAQTYTDHGLYTLALPDVTEKESGLYTCRAWSSHGAVDMNASVIVVQPNQYEGKPATIISRPAKDLLISNGEDLNVSFRVRGEPKPKVFFMKGIRDITNSQRVCKMTSDDYVKFTLKRSVVSDAGTYCVFVRNAYGCDRAFVTVVIRQRASSENLISDWTYPMDDLAISVVERNYKSVPDRIPSEPTTVDGGSNWVALAWPKPDSQMKAPILAYKVESWLLGKEGGARWIELGITPRNSFDAFNLKQGEEYHFRVTPRNRYGWGESVQTSTPICIGLTGDRPEFIEILPGQLKVLVGETASLYCSFKGNPMPEILWMKNGHEIEEETERVTVELNDNNTSLRINNTRIEDEGRYSCEATNIHGRSSTYSRMAVITDKQIWEADAKLKRERSAGENGEYPPQFTMRLRDRRVQATYPVRLTCQVIGSPRPIVTWFKNGEEVSVDKRRTTSQDEYFYTLEIAPTTLEDGGVYEAMARNGFGAISCRCNLVVDKGIRAYIAPEFCCGFEPLYRVCEGDELRISAVVEAYPSVGVTWYRDGVRLRPSRRAVMTLDRDGQIELAVASVAARDAGVYTCTASNEVGRASTSGKVEVIKGEHTAEIPRVPPIVISRDLPYSKEPMFIRKPRSSEAREGDTVIIECEVIGDPKPDVYWLRDFLKPDYYRDASHFKRVGAGPAYRFEIPHAKFDYTGAYSIVAKNIHGEAKAIISLQILAKDITCTDDTHNIRYGRVETIPHFEKELTDLLCYDGDAIEFECRVSGNPEPDIRWFHYTEVIPDSPDFETSYELGISRLKIKQVTAEDEGTYTCEASNNMGKATSSACLVIYPPGEPNTLSQRLRRPPALMSASSTPRSTPRTTPARSLSRTPGPDLRRLGSPSREIAPKFYTYPYNRVVEEGDTVVFQCAVRGLPPPWATWDKDGIIITPTSRISIREKDDMFRILEIEQVSIEDVGLYRVTLENDYGRAEASARLEVITQMGKFYGSRSYSMSPRKCLSYRRRTPSITRQD